jgi:Ca2+-binding EF-hand superfamily protein
VQFFVAGKLDIFIERAKNLLLPEELSRLQGGNGADPSLARFDPYVRMEVEGRAVAITKRTPADKDGSKDPVWQAHCLFDLVDQDKVQIKVFAQNLLNKSSAGGSGGNNNNAPGMGDTLIGYAELSLLPVYRNGIFESWITLKQRKMTGGVREVGDVFLKLSFIGPVGISYPQCRSDVDVFDDTLRKAPGELGVDKARQKREDEVEEEGKHAISTIPEDGEEAGKSRGDKESDNRSVMSREPRDGQEFSEDEIIAAFKFIDLDRNNFVGAAEIRHILVCMGEMITDEEIDTMIGLVDLDGDGQVSYKEFRALVLHPNPGLVDMHKELIKVKDDELMQDKQALAGKATTLDLTAFQRQKELLSREEKKKKILQFIEDNEVNFEYIRQSYLNYLDIPRVQRAHHRVTFDQFCLVLRIEAINEYRVLHGLYDDEESGTVDFREFLLSMMNFVAVDKEERIKFSFEMFDENKTGFIAQAEITEILRGNHMLSLQSVTRKAETIMKQATSTQNGTITLKEFLVISRKFPNILFPTAGITSK